MLSLLSQLIRVLSVVAALRTLLDRASLKDMHDEVEGYFDEALIITMIGKFTMLYRV